MGKRGIVFLEFLIGGIIIGVLEDLILIRILTTEQFTFHILWIVILVTIPFAFLGEYIIDKINFLKIFGLNKKYKKLEVFLEFLIFGILLGVVEDITAFYFSVGGAITSRVILVAFLIAIPFAFVSEFLIDKIDMEKSFKRRRLVWKK